MPEKIDDDRLRIVTIHSPELPHERQISVLSQRVKEFDLIFPVLIDNDLLYFRQLAAPGWPAFYLIDKQGRLRHLFLGETHSHFAQAREMEKKLRLLLQED